MNSCLNFIIFLGECKHNDKQRAITGTFVTLEVDRAVKEGYQILKTFEIWHFEETDQYDRATKSGGMFTGYMNDALKKKQEASGFPENCETDEQKDEYINRYYENEGIKLDKSKIAQNAGQRLVAKLWANSLWGFFALNTNRSQFKIISDEASWQELLQNDRYEINNVYSNNFEHLQVSFTERDVYHSGNNKTNVIIAAFVTSLARLHLFDELQRLGDRVLYFDTDSIFYVSRPNEYEPVLGDYLGQFTNEISPQKGNHIVEFVSAGPKNYAYKLDTGYTECTVKGITFNYLTSLSINFDHIKELVSQNRNNIVEVPQQKFLRNKQNWSVKTEIVQKKYRYVYDKRIVLDDFTTLPYGY